MSSQFFPAATLTEPIYIASKAPVVRVLFEMETGAQRDALALKLAQQGFILDDAVDVGGYDVVTTMGIRKQLGFTWVPSAMQAPLNGVIATGPVPPGAIKVSIDAADYPPYSGPATDVVKKILGNLQQTGFLTYYTVGPDAEIHNATQNGYLFRDGDLAWADLETGIQQDAGVGTRVQFHQHFFQPGNSQGYWTVANFV